MRLKTEAVKDALLGIGTEILYALLIMAAAFLLSFFLTFKK